MKARLQRNSKRRRQLRLALVAFIIVCLGFLLPKIVTSISFVVTYPFHATNQWLQESSSLVPVFFRDRVTLEEEIKDLKNQVAVLENNDLTQGRLIHENKQLRSLLGTDEAERIAAAVIARPNELPYDLLQIDRGLDHGVEVGAPVFVGQDIVIGLVVHSAREYSFVSLVTSPGFESTAFITGSNVAVSMEGIGSGVARVKVPQGINLAVGDSVLLPSVEPGIFGQISFVESSPTQPEQFGYISPQLSINSLYFVSVGKLSQITRSSTEINEKIKQYAEDSLYNSEVDVIVSTTTATSTATSTEVMEIDSEQEPE